MQRGYVVSRYGYGCQTKPQLRFKNVEEKSWIWSKDEDGKEINWALQNIIVLSPREIQALLSASLSFVIIEMQTKLSTDTGVLQEPYRAA